MTERTDTTGVELKPKGHYCLRIDRVIKSSIGKEGQKQYPGYKWYFDVMSTDSGFDTDSFDMFMFKSQMGDILRTCGAKEISEGIFEWNLEDMTGKVIECEMAHVDVKGKLREQLIEIVASTPVVKEEKSWDE